MPLLFFFIIQFTCSGRNGENIMATIDDLFKVMRKGLQSEQLHGRELACIEHAYLRLLSTAKEYDYDITKEQEFFRNYIRDKNNILMWKRRTGETYD